MDPDETLDIDDTKVDSNFGDETLDMTQTFTGDSGVSDDPARKNLIQNYKHIISDNAIYYPVSYQFQHLLGEGRQGKVFLAHRQGGRGCTTRHAIKVFDPSIYSDATKYWTDMGRIASQLSALQTIRSPHMASLDSYDEVNGIGYVQMELINGFNLRQLLNANYMEKLKTFCSEKDWDKYSHTIFRYENGHFSIQPGIAIYVMRMMLKGLEIIHNAGFIHSDLKPANVMVNSLGYIKLIDFGRAAKPREKMTMLLGTPMYMAPEIHRRELNTEQSDLYSVGLIGLEMLTGKPLLEGTNITEAKLLAAKCGLPERLEGLLPDYVLENNDFVEVLRKFTHPDPYKRHENAVAAETEDEGLRIVHKQLALMGHDADYSRLMGDFMSMLIDFQHSELA